MHTEVVTGTAATLYAEIWEPFFLGNLIPWGSWRFCGGSKWSVSILMKADLCRTRGLKTPINFFPLTWRQVTSCAWRAPTCPDHVTQEVQGWWGDSWSLTQLWEKSCERANGSKRQREDWFSATIALKFRQTLNSPKNVLPKYFWNSSHSLLMLWKWSCIPCRFYLIPHYSFYLSYPCT